MLTSKFGDWQYRNNRIFENSTNYDVIVVSGFTFDTLVYRGKGPDPVESMYLAFEKSCFDNATASFP